MKLFTIFAAISLFVNFAFANDFLGTNTIYSEQMSDRFAMETSLNADGTGSVVTFLGSSDITWTENEEGKLSLTLTEALSVKALAFVENPQGHPVQVEVLETLKEITLAKDTAIAVETVWQITSDDPRFEEKTRTDAAKDLAMTTEFANHEFTAEEGLRMALPSFGADQTAGIVHVEFQANQKAVTLRSFDGFPFPEMVWTLSDDKKELTMSVPNVASTRYRIIQTGTVHKVVAYTTLGTSQKIMSQHMSYDAQVPKELITEEAVMGSYQATTTVSDEDLFYHFEQDNLGGFSFTMPDGTEGEDHWSWKVEEGVITAEQYVKVDAEGNITGVPESRDEVAQCADATLACQIRAQREYRILAAEGNTYSLLRTYSQKLGGNANFSSIWVFEKQ